MLIFVKGNVEGLQVYVSVIAEAHEDLLGLASEQRKYTRLCLMNEQIADCAWLPCQRVLGQQTGVKLRRHVDTGLLL